VGATAGLAAHPLDADEIVDLAGARPALVVSPADQAVTHLTFGAIRGDREDVLLGRDCCTIVFDGTGVMEYNDHSLGTPLSS
jgi:hypothetical protein